MLSFERKLECSDGLMFAGNWGDKQKEYIDDEQKIKAWKEISVSPRNNRGTQSMYMDENKRDDAIKPNPVKGDDATLPTDKDTLKINFTFRVIGNLGKPFACNKPDFAQAIEKKVSEFKQSESINDLAFRYAYNIANGRFLWRNRVGAEEIVILVKVEFNACESSLMDKVDDETLEFNAYDFLLMDFDKNRDNANLGKLTETMRKGLTGNENTFALVSVEAYVKLGKGQHVFPSQEMNIGEKKKKLFQLDGCAAMHNVKIGNAIRTIDTWYGEQMLIKAEGKDKTETVNIDTDIKQPIAIEPYGSVTQHGRAYRPSKNDLYSLILDWVNSKENVNEDDKRFVVGNLIRGGVFGGDS
jgi:CRISPR-associated protein Csy3